MLIHLIGVMLLLKFNGCNRHEQRVSSSCSTRHVCEGSTLHLNCTSNSQIKIITALYGRMTYSVCRGGWLHRTNCMASSALRIVSKRCTGNHYCNVEASNNVFGDPCRLIFKYLEVRYCCIETDDKTTRCTSTTNVHATSIGSNESASGPSHQREFPVTTIILITAVCVVTTVVILSICVAVYKFKKRKNNQESSVNLISQVATETLYVDNDDDDIMRIGRAHRYSAETKTDDDKYGVLSNEYALFRQTGTYMTADICSNEYDEINRHEIWTTSLGENAYGVAHGQQLGDLATVPVQNEYEVTYKKVKEVTTILSIGDAYAVVNRTD